MCMLLIGRNTWNAELDSIFSIGVAETPKSEKQAGRCTSHRLLTSQEIIQAKREEKERKDKLEQLKEERKRKREMNKLVKMEKKLKKSV